MALTRLSCSFVVTFVSAHFLIIKQSCNEPAARPSHLMYYIKKAASSPTPTKPSLLYSFSRFCFRRK